MNMQTLGSGLLIVSAVLLLCAIAVWCYEDAKASKLEGLKRKLAKLQARYDDAVKACKSSTLGDLRDAWDLKGELSNKVSQVQHEIQRLEKP